MGTSGASNPPEAMMHFSPVSDFPPIFEKNLDFLENFTNFPFSRKKFPFSSAKISDDLFKVTDHKFRISPLFCLFYNISPLIRQCTYWTPLMELPQIYLCLRLCFFTFHIVDFIDYLFLHII